MNHHFDAPDAKSYALHFAEAQKKYSSQDYQSAFDIACKAAGLATPSAGWTADYPDWNHAEILGLLEKVDGKLRAYAPKHEQLMRLKGWFPENRLCPIEGFVKQVTISEVEENDWSLTPGRYVGYSIELDEDFDYAARLGEIHSELEGLNLEAATLMQQILKGAA